jgi:undecaprenyl-diphosphatase
MTATTTSALTRPRTVVSGALLLAAMVVLALIADDGPLTPAKAILLGAVEGITEYLPVSSTGHLLVTQRLIGLGEGEGKVAADTYAVAIQVGAIAAVAVLYRERIWSMVLGLVGRDDAGRTLLIRMALAFTPAALIGVALGDLIKDRLFGPGPVIAAWAVGGAFLLFWTPRNDGGVTLETLSVRAALTIGFAQSLALWPGMSRSLVTIVAALALGMAIASAVEFSFLLGLATLTAATVLDLAKDGPTLLEDYGWETPLLGTLVAFVTAVLAVRWLVAYLRDRPLRGFGWYRLGAATVTLALLLLGVI